MDDNMLLEAISKMMDEKLEQTKKEITAQTAEQIQAARKEIARDTVALMDAEFKGKFDLLAEELQLLQDRLPNMETISNLPKLASSRLTNCPNGHNMVVQR